MPQERLQPALLDRLTDDDPATSQEPREQRVMSKTRMRQAVLRDLAWLFNATKLERGSDMATVPYARHSVINFGLSAHSGQTASSLEIEDLILRVPGIAEAAVVGVPDEKWGERPIAFVVVKPGAGTAPTEQAIKQHVADFADKGTVSKYAVPDRVHFVDAIPKTSVGKLDKKVLRAQLGDAQATAAAH